LYSLENSLLKRITTCREIDYKANNVIKHKLFTPASFGNCETVGSKICESLILRYRLLFP